MTRWFQVTIYPYTFGFQETNGTITKHNEDWWVGKPLLEYGIYLKEQEAIVTMICRYGYATQSNI